MKISIVIPVLNERLFIENSLLHLKSVLSELEVKSIGIWEVIISDAGSTDGTLSIIDKFVRKSSSWIVSAGPIADPSIGKTVREGILKATGDFILILPADSQLRKEGFEELWQTVQSGFECGGFPKKYFPSNLILIVYQVIQNIIRLKYFRQLVWTNGIFFKKTLVGVIELPTLGFLEDVILSDFLRKAPKWKALSEHITISSRRYNPNSVRRIFINLFIIICFRARIATPEKLKTIYG